MIVPSPLTSLLEPKGKDPNLERVHVDYNSSTGDTESLETSSLFRPTSEVRLPIEDHRRPGTSVQASDHSTSHSPRSISATSSLLASPILLSSSDQIDHREQVPFAPLDNKVTDRRRNTSTPDNKRDGTLTVKPDKNTSSPELRNDLKVSIGADTAHRLQRSSRKDPADQGMEAARRRFLEDKSKRLLEVQRAEGAQKLHQNSPLPRKPGPKNPRQPSAMSGYIPPHSRSLGRSGRSTTRPTNSMPYYPNMANANFRTNDWRMWQDVGVKVFDIPVTTTTRDLYLSFSKEGTIIAIDLYEDTRGQREGKACVKFSPPPSRPFWNSGHFVITITGEGSVTARVQLEAPKRTFLHPSPVYGQKKYDEVMVMKANSLDFGMIFSPNLMMSLCTVLPTLEHDINFRVNLLHHEISVEFMLDIRDPRTSRSTAKDAHVGKDDREERFRFRIPFSQLDVIETVESADDKLVLLISLETPPKFFKKLDAAGLHDEKTARWCENDSWYRQTDIVYAYRSLKKAPLCLNKTRPVIDIGRWTTYRLVFDDIDNLGQTYNSIQQALQDYNIEIKPRQRLRTVNHIEPPIWAFLDSPRVPKRSSANALIELTQDILPELAFQVRYQLEVCISNNYLNEHNLNQAFIDHLASIGSDRSRDLLEWIANHAKRIYNPMHLLGLNIAAGASVRAKIPSYCVYIRSATVTPTAVYFQTPVPETSNRVIRQYSQYADRFLRVRFTEEKTEGRIHGNDKNTENEIFTRVKRVLQNGIIVGGRSYEFLACGNSQFRENGAYFFAPLPHLPIEKIRKWMGMFDDIETVPLYLARLGQCFSTTRAISSQALEVKEIRDITRAGYNFTDGVGKISPLLAHVAASQLGILQHSEEPPSVFQIRVGGCKGVLAVWQTPRPMEIQIRRSQYKFPAKHEGLEIIRWSQFTCANLNRQLILVLSALGVPDQVFGQKLRLQLSNLEQAMTDEGMALGILQKDVDPNQMTLVVASMILDGFQKSEEPFMTSLLQLWRTWSIHYLKEKARITIGAGALFFGCVDETGILQGHFDSVLSPPMDAPIEEKAQSVPQVFVQLSKNDHGKPQVILGPMLLARNPSLHPGDIRVVNGVDVPELHHLKDVVVLPQTGDRDIASMCSGGDLDGDDFLVIWDKDLLPREWNHEPMDYSRPDIAKHGQKIGIDDLTNFFVTYMKNDTLSRIARNHLAMADFMEEGVKDKKCKFKQSTVNSIVNSMTGLELANLHSMAVDFVKTGHPAQMSRDLIPPKRPHFMDTGYQKKEKTYISRKVLGQLYDQVESVDFVPQFANQFDSRILTAYELSDTLLYSACEVKKEYDAHVQRIMAQHEIKTEFEVWSTFVLHHSNTINDFKFHEQIGQISSALKGQFRALCYERAGGKTFEQIGPFAAAMYKVTAFEMTNAVQECHQVRHVGGRAIPLRRMTVEEMPLMSFPWLFQNILGKIANRGPQRIGTDSAITHRYDPAGTTLNRAQARRHPSQLVHLSNISNLETAKGITQPGEVLQLFGDSNN